ncbi:MAG: 4'-phosphopantetheinyl transferase superfamily protein [Paracoccaceae bacterium]|jgi:4'-phosphopantetheinyl transferase EntD|nr:4'-phosphopantetheinyl transferase superfamily protein [Paracoccaceae bacterium]
MTADLERSIAALFGGPVAVAVLPVNGPHPPLMPQEARAVARAVQTRRDEFTAGRAAARLAMERLGLPPQAVPAAPDRSPVWPDGLTGSISHAGGLCAAVLSRDPLHKLGLDIEDAAPLDADLWPLVLTPDELDRLAQAPADRRGTIAKRIFGIKEAAYKAQFPLTGAVIGFQALDVTLAPDPQADFARLRATDIGTMVPQLGKLFPDHGAISRIAGPTAKTFSLMIAAITLPA